MYWYISPPTSSHNSHKPSNCADGIKFLIICNLILNKFTISEFQVCDCEIFCGVPNDAQYLNDDACFLPVKCDVNALVCLSVDGVISTYNPFP